MTNTNRLDVKNGKTVNWYRVLTARLRIDPFPGHTVDEILQAIYEGRANTPADYQPWPDYEDECIDWIASDSGDILGRAKVVGQAMSIPTSDVNPKPPQTTDIDNL